MDSGGTELDIYMTFSEEGCFFQTKPEEGPRNGIFIESIEPLDEFRLRTIACMLCAPKYEPVQFFRVAESL